MGSDSSIPSKFRYSRFQSTRPREERPICFVVTRPRYRVSIHAPTRGATLQPQLLTNLLPGCNPRSHVGSDGNPPILYTTAPSFNPRSHVGSDYWVNPLYICKGVSIHAPTRGATHTNLLHRDCSRCFNPRPHVGSDFTKSLLDFDGKVSIHAPTWGATKSGFRTGFASPVSIHAPTWGATTASWSEPSCVLVFQSTPPRGERRKGGGSL